MSDKATVIYRNAKKKVRRIYTQGTFTASTTASHVTIWTAPEKCTIMGYDIFMEKNATAGATGDSITGFQFYVDPAARDRAPSASTALAAEDLDSEIFEKGMFQVSAPGEHPVKRFKTRKRRKMNKGDLIKFSFISAAIDANYRTHYSGIIYIGE